jgi:hypothetical protein
MKTRVLLWLVIVAAMATAYFQRGELMREREALTKIEHRQAEIAAQQLRAEQQRRATEEGSAASETDLAAGAVLRRDGISNGGTPAAVSGMRATIGVSNAAIAAALQTRSSAEPMISAAIWPSAGFRLRIGSNPALLSLYRTAFYASMEPLWGPFFERMDLNPDQVRRFADAQWELEQVKIDTATLTLKSGLNGESIRQTWNQADLDMKAQVRALLGGSDDRDAQYHAYSVQAGVRPFIGDLAGILASSGTPLAKGQADDLAAILFDASQKTPGGWAIGYQVKWNEALPRAKELLSPAQLTALQAMITQHQAFESMMSALQHQH